jgi:hypothetical protein
VYQEICAYITNELGPLSDKDREAADAGMIEMGFNAMSLDPDNKVSEFIAMINKASEEGGKGTEPWGPGPDPDGGRLSDG